MSIFSMDLGIFSKRPKLIYLALIILLSVCSGFLWYNSLKVEISKNSFFEIKLGANERPAFENSTGTRLRFFICPFKNKSRIDKPIKNP